jgi:DNA-binding CsgD family transcriptional regulator
MSRDKHNRGAAMTKDSVAGDKGIKKHSCLEDLPTPDGESMEIEPDCADELWRLSIQRSLEQSLSSADEKRKLAQLSKGLSSTAAISQALGLVATRAVLDAFEISDTAVLLFDRLGSVIGANQSAKQLIKGDVKLSRGKLVSNDPNAARAVEQALSKFLGTSEVALAAPIPLPRERQRPLLVYLLKLPSLTANSGAECRAIAVLIDPDKRSVPTDATLRALFKLTPAEARLAGKVSCGAALDEAAASLGISKETSKSRLKNIFAKAGVHRQAELVALVGSTASPGILNTLRLSPKSKRRGR